MGEGLASRWFLSIASRVEGAVFMRVAYIMSRFPKLTETFILYEILAVERQGVAVDLYPLMRARSTAVHPEGASLWRKVVERFSRAQGATVMHPEAAPLVERAHFSPFVSLRILRSQVHFLRRVPRAYLQTLWTVIRSNMGSANYLFGALSVFPQTVYRAELMFADGVGHVHAHFANHPAAAAFIIHRLTGIPYSFTAHGADLQVDQHMLREKVAEAAFVVTISQYNKELIVQVCGEEVREKVVVIRCGVDTQVFRVRGDGGQVVCGGRPFRILCTGTLYEVKGQTYLIEACRVLKARGVEVMCQFVGDGPDLAALREQVRQAGLEEQVRFLGLRRREEIVGLLGEVDVVVVPSIPTMSGRREGIPVVLMEAMASGVPVVASGISGIPELVEDGQSGLLVPPRDPLALADALGRLYADPALRGRLGQGGRAMVLREFDLHTNAAMLAQRFRVVRQ